MPATNRLTAFAHVTEQQVEDLAFLWLLWDRAAHQPDQTAATRAKLERRMNAHLNGLAVSPDIAWARALETEETCDAGELFVLAMLALERGDPASLARVVALSQAQPHARRGLVSALGWQNSARVYPLLKPWIASDNPYERYLAVAACSVRRLDPQAYLQRLLRDPANREQPDLYARLLRLVGELKRTDLVAELRPAMAEEGEPAFWAHWSALMLGESRACAGLAPFVLDPEATQRRAIDLAFRASPANQAWDWINQLVNSGQDGAVVRALGALGDPRGVNWLLTRMEEPELAKQAAEAFTLITGVDLEAAQLTQLSPPAAPEPDVMAVTDYEHRPYPAPEKALRYWGGIRHRFTPGQRYLMGVPVADAPLQAIWRDGLQPQRRAAAIEWALSSPQAPYPNLNAPVGTGGGL
ncbi:TIGR02270 family protein [Marinimicrobium locisalis]|uniref:TIGR02270 family protein n=1 Tax=Marinimicrobium locisalis TaxID=546022 RepID=UPI00322183AE